MVPFLLIVSLSFGACSFEARPDPKDTIRNMFEAVRSSDKVALSANIDLESAAVAMRRDLAPGNADTTTAVTDWGERLLAALTGEGTLRRRWFTDNQIVLGRSEINADTALVEVSFLDRVTRVQYYNKMRLVFRNGRWVITSFRTL